MKVFNLRMICSIETHLNLYSQNGKGTEYIAQNNINNNGQDIHSLEIPNISMNEWMSDMECVL